MLTNSEVTLFRYSEETDKYENIGTFRAWVHRKDRLHRNSAGEVRRDSFAVRVSVQQLAEVRVGDRLCFGRVSGGCAGVEYDTVSRVRDNRFGMEPHWLMETDYIAAK